MGEQFYCIYAGGSMLKSRKRKRSDRRAFDPGRFVDGVYWFNSSAGDKRGMLSQTARVRMMDHGPVLIGVGSLHRFGQFD